MRQVSKSKVDGRHHTGHEQDYGNDEVPENFKSIIRVHNTLFSLYGTRSINKACENEWIVIVLTFFDLNRLFIRKLLWIHSWIAVAWVLLELLLPNQISLLIWLLIKTYLDTLTLLIGARVARRGIEESCLYTNSTRVHFFIIVTHVEQVEPFINFELRCIFLWLIGKEFPDR